MPVSLLTRVYAQPAPCVLKYFTPQLKSHKLFHSYYRPLDFLQNVVGAVDCGSEEEF